MKKIKLILPLLAFCLFSCDDYFDINSNPNDLHAVDTQPDKYLPAAQVGSYRVQAITMNRLGHLFSNAMGGNVQSFASPFADEFNLNVSTTFYPGIFENLYLNVNTFQKIIDYQDVTGVYSGYKVAAKICKAHYMQYIVDLYGDAPYKEAFRYPEILTPKYNDDQVIYKELLNELDEARALIVDINAGVYGPYDPESTDPTVNGFGLDTKDVMLKGNLAEWEKFANTIELRMLVRMSNNTGAVAAWRDQRLAALADKDFISTDVKINPGYSSSNDDQVNPVVFSLGWNAAGNPTGYNQYCLSGHFLKCLNAYTEVNYASPSEQEVMTGTGVFYPDVNDPRRFGLFLRAVNTNPASPYHRGVTQGSTVVDVFKPGGITNAQPSKLASKFFNAYNETNSTVLGNAQAVVSGYVMTASESFFLQAEAALLGETQPAYALLGLNAEANFDSGVTQSMLFYQSTIGTYLTDIKAKPNFGYNATFTYQQRYHSIMYQKWIALLNSNAIEAYIDNTRTGYPLAPMSLSASQPNRPKRLIYPNSEYVANSGNVPNVALSDIFVVNEKSPFWLQGNPALGN